MATNRWRKRCTETICKRWRKHLAAESRMIEKLTLPPDPDGKNNDRAAWAKVALDAFMKETGTDLEDALCDLLCDLMHLSDREPLNSRPRYSTREIITWRKPDSRDRSRGNDDWAAMDAGFLRPCPKAPRAPVATHSGQLTLF